jgi:serine phosphatase RsbU (regulator of sigma subunit)
VNAGHPAAAVLSRHGGTRLLTATSPAVGWLADAAFVESTVQLCHGDLFATFSDGFTEAESADAEPFGVDGVVGVLDDARDREPRAIVDATIAAVRRFTADAPPADDRTLVVAKFEAAR